MSSSQNTTYVADLTLYYGPIFNQAFLYETWSVLLISIAQIAILLWLMLRGSGKLKWRDVFTYINIYIFMMTVLSLGSIGSYWFYGQIPNQTSTMSIVTDALSDVSFSTLQVVIMLYSWCRGMPVVEIVAPWLVLPCRITVWIFPIVMAGVAVFSTSILYIFGHVYFMINLILTPLGCVVLASFDLAMTASYFAYIWKSRTQFNELDVNRLKIISQFGVASGVWSLLWFISQIIQFCYSFKSASEFDWILNFVTFAMFNVMPTGYVFIQLAMKYSLQQETKESTTNRETRIKQAKKGTMNSSISTSNN